VAVTPHEHLGAAIQTATCGKRSSIALTLETAFIMDTTRLLAIILIVAGLFGLGYGGFTYTSETHEANIGPMHMSVDEKKRFNVPVWAGIGLIVVGGGLLLGRARR
jgi:hypothetical protein